MKHVLSGLVFTIAAGLVHAQPTTRPLMLVASPELQGLYSRTALIAVPVGESHLGLIVNRATDIRLATLFPRHAPSAKVSDPVHFGGPEMADAIFAVVRRDPGAGALPLFDGLQLVATADVVDRIIEQTPADARFFAGFVGWKPGELDKEIEAGYWYVTDPDSALFFRRDTTGLWDELIVRVGNGHSPQRGSGFLSASLAITNNAYQKRPAR
jgi:putative transcriptional regulator